MDDTKLSVIVPCFNEGDNLLDLHAALADAASDGDEFILVNDGSTDASAGLLARLEAADSRVRPLHLAVRQGQTRALWEGLQMVRGRWIAHLDGDLQNDPRDLPGMLQLAVSENLDAVLGFRAKRDDDLGRRLASRFANTVRHLALGDSIRDVGCSTRVVRSEVLRQLPPVTNLHRYLPAIIQMGHWRVAQVPTRHHSRRHGRSKYGNLSRGLEGLRDLPRMARYIRTHQAEPNLEEKP